MLKISVVLLAITAGCLSCNIPEFQVIIYKFKHPPKTIPYSKDALKDVISLNAHKQNIPVLCKQIFAFDNEHLMVLQIIDSKVKEIQPKTFYGLQVTELQLRYNLIESIDDIFDNPKLEYIQLQNNAINKISPHAFDKLPNLKDILLSNNKLTHIDVNWFKNNPNIQNINLSGNLIVHLPEGFLKNLYKANRMVELNKNPLETVAEAAFENVENLQVDLLDTKLKKLSKMFKGTTSVNKMFLDAPKPECFSPDEVENLTVVQNLYLREKNLSRGCYEALRTWGKLNHIYVDKIIDFPA